jgi:hypothetical protein
MLALRIALGLAATWTLMGAIPGYLDPEDSFARFFGVPAESALVLELYRGAWGQTLLFAVGYGVATLDPRRHVLVVVLGACGKLIYAIRILVSLADRPPTTLALSAAIGDLVLVATLGTLLLLVWSRDRARRIGAVSSAPA